MNKNIFRFVSFLAITLSLTLSSCKKDEEEEPAPTSATLQFEVNAVSSGLAVSPSNLSYQNVAGNSYKIDVLKYFLSNIELVKADGSFYQAKNYEFINHGASETVTFSLTNVPNGVYTRIRFFLGIDSLANHTIVNDDDLDPSTGMIWSWNTGYIFFKHEGKFIDSTGQERSLLFHYGTDRGRALVDLPLDQFTLTGATKRLKISLDLEKLYGDPNIIDFNQYNNNQSLTIQEYPWIDQMRENFQNAFQVIAQ
jgi:hypothetical protein